MFSRSFLIFLLSQLFIVLFAHGNPQLGYETLAYDNSPKSSFGMPGRIVAIGDIHGDFDALVTILKGMQLIDSAGNWIGGTTHLVLMGDLSGRGPLSRLVEEYVMELEYQAIGQGGWIHTLIGNHELLKSQGDFRYETEQSAALYYDFAPQGDGLYAAYRGDSPIARWISERNSIVQIGDTILCTQVCMYGR